MLFQNIIGHNQIKKNLEQAIQTDKIKHAYLFAGQEHLGKFLLACEFAKILNQKNYTLKQIQANKVPDILVIQPEPESQNLISIQQIRELQRKLSLSPFESKYKIAIIDQAHFLKTEAANALLKTLEEPLGQAVLILISFSQSALLPTIVSRCEVLKFWPVSQNQIQEKLFKQIDQNKLKKIMQIVYMRPGIAVHALSSQKFFKEQQAYIQDWQKLSKANLVERFKYAEILSKNNLKLRETLKAWIFYLRSELIKKPGITLLNQLKKIQKSLNLILSSNVNQRLVLEVLMLEVF